MAISKKLVRRLARRVSTDALARRLTFASVAVAVLAVVGAQGARAGDEPPVSGAIGAEYVALGGQNSVLGAPVSGEFIAAVDGRGQHFALGSIYWSPATGAHEVHGAIREIWHGLGWEQSFLGYPLTDETVLTRDNGRYNHFQGGSIYWSPATGAHEVHGAIREAWAAAGWENGPLRYPTSNEYDVPGGRRSDFQGGSLTWSGSTGVVTQGPAGPPPTASQPVTIEAESLSLDASSGRILADAAASGNKALEIWSTAAASTTTMLPTAGSVTVRARGDQCAGAPQLSASIDGGKFGTVAVAATTWTDYALPAAVTAGTHQVAISFDNDYLDSRCDRNLFLDRIVVNPSGSMTTPPTPPPPTPGVTGWASGASYASAASFGIWRGEPSTVAGFWADADDANQRNVYGITDFANWTGAIDVAPGMIVQGESLSAAADGAYEARWRNAMQVLRNNWGSKRTIYIRPAHEMNGNWYAWSVTSANTAAFKRAWIRYYNIVQQELVSKGFDAKVTFALNKDPVNNLSPNYFWPGDQYVDVVGVDFYDAYPSYFTQGDWDAHFNDVKAGGPYGIGAYRDFARMHGKPLAFPEWGTNPHATQDNPFFIQKMNEFFRNDAGTGPGQVLYEVYFNTWDQDQLYPTTNVPRSAAMYRSLTWGRPQ